MVVSIISLVIGVAALTASLVALWRTHLSGFQPKTVVGPLTMRIFPITNDESKWFIASFLSSLTVTNNGASPGAVTGLRLKLQFSGLKADAFETIPVKWEMDSADVMSITVIGSSGWRKLWDGGRSLCCLGRPTLSMFSWSLAGRSQSLTP